MMYKPNEILPSENELAEEFNVTRVTVRNAIKKLKDEGIIRTEKGKGSFVNRPKIVQNLNNIYSLGMNTEETGYSLENEIVEIVTLLPDNNIRKSLMLEEDEKVVNVRIIRKLEGIPVVIQMSYLPKKIVSDIKAEHLKKTTIYDLLENKYQIKLANAKEYLDPIVADEIYSMALNVEVNTPLFMTERTTYAENEIPVEYRKCIIRSDKFRFSVELK